MKEIQTTVYNSGLNSDAFGNCHIDDYPSGYLEVFTCQNDEGISFTIPPNEDGIEEAKSIIKALQSWVKKTEVSFPNLVKKDKEDVIEFT